MQSPLSICACWIPRVSRGSVWLCSVSCRWDKQVISVREAKAFTKNNSPDWRNKYICVEGKHSSTRQMSVCGVAWEWPRIVFQSRLKEGTSPAQSTSRSNLTPLELSLQRYVTYCLSLKPSVGQWSVNYNPASSSSYRPAAAVMAETTHEEGPELHPPCQSDH